MKQFIVDRHTTPNTPTLEQVPTDKIPLYPSEQDLLDDLANLEVGQIAGTIDPAESELIGVLMQRMNNNVLLSALEDITLSANSASPSVMQYDGYLIINGNGHAQRHIKAYVNTKEVYIADGYSGQGNECSSATIPVVKGDEVYLSYDSSTQSSEIFAYGRFYKVRDYSSR
jgi:hypothetical protein